MFALCSTLPGFERNNESQGSSANARACPDAETALRKEMAGADPNPFAYGSTWLRADFHLHTKADKEFVYDGEDNAFGTAFVDRLKAANVGLGIISNHNKFDADEFKALHKRAKKEGIGLLPGVELSVNDGANGVHTIIVFSDQWLEDGHDYINQFLNVAFTGKTPAQYEQENGRTNDDLLQTLKKLQGYNGISSSSSLMSRPRVAFGMSWMAAAWRNWPPTP